MALGFFKDLLRNIIKIEIYIRYLSLSSHFSLVCSEDRNYLSLSEHAVPCCRHDYVKEAFDLDQLRDAV